MKPKLMPGSVPQQTVEGIGGIFKQTGKEAASEPGESLKAALGQMTGSEQFSSSEAQAKTPEEIKQITEAQRSAHEMVIQSHNVQQDKQEERPSIPKKNPFETVQAPPGKRIGVPKPDKQGYILARESGPKSRH